MAPCAPVLRTGPSMIRTPAAPSFWITASSDSAAMKHRSSEPGTGTCACGLNSWPHSWRLIFWLPNVSAARGVVRIGGNVGGAVDATGGNFGGFHCRQHFGLRALARPLGDGGVDALHRGRAPVIPRKRRVVAQVFAADRVHQPP